MTLCLSRLVEHFLGPSYYLENSDKSRFTHQMPTETRQVEEYSLPGGAESFQVESWKDCRCRHGMVSPVWLIFRRETIKDLKNICSS